MAPIDYKKMNKRKERAAIFSILSNSFLVSGKIVIGIITGSVGILSEAIHSGIDLVASGVAWWSVRQSAKPPDHEHPYGHGKIETLAAFFESLLIVGAAIWIIWEGVSKIFVPAPMEALGLGIGVMAFSVILNTMVSRHLYKVGEETKSQALIADAHHLAADIWSSLGVLVGLVIVYFTGWKWVDPIIAIGVGLWILRTGLKLSFMGVGELIDETMPEEDEKIVIEILKSDPRILTYHHFRSRKSGNLRMIDLHIHLDAEISFLDSHRITHEIQDKIKKALGGCDVVIHTEPSLEVREKDSD